MRNFGIVSTQSESGSIRNGMGCTETACFDEHRNEDESRYTPVSVTNFAIAIPSSLQTAITKRSVTLIFNVRSGTG